MKLYQIAFFITVVTTFYLHIKKQMPMIKARRRMIKAIRKKGGDPVVSGFWDFLMLEDPNLILTGTEDAEIRALKMDFINKWKEVLPGYHFIFIWALCGFAITVIIGVLEEML